MLTEEAAKLSVLGGYGLTGILGKSGLGDFPDGG